MDSPTVLTVVAAIAVQSIVSPIPEFPTELYIVPYIMSNLLFFSYLLARSMTYSAVLISLLSTNATFLLTSALLAIVRRLFFSPLRRFPGPKLAAISGFWNANEARLGRASRTYKALHKKYKSDVIRIGPNELSINNADAIDKLYGGKYIRGTFNQVFNLAGGNNLASLRDHEKHSAWRRMWGKGFTRTEVSHYTERVQGHADKTVRMLHEKAGNPVDCGKILEALAFDVIMDLAFSRDARLQEGHGDRRYIELINGFLQFANVVGHLPHLQQIFRYLPLNDDGRLFINLSNLILSDRQALKTPRKDIFTHLLASDHKTNFAMTQMDLQQQIFLTLVVGTHSISTTLTQTFAALASRPDVQARIRQELNNAFDGTGVPPTETVRHLKYVEAVVKEGLRMFPPLLGGTPAIAPKGGVALKTGDFIPENTQVWISQHVLMSDDRYFPRAAEFLPERWMDQEGENDGKGNELMKDRRAWIPFGYGTHACGGRALALEELKLLVVRFVREFDICFGQEGGQPFNLDEWADSWKDVYLTMIQKIDLRFIPRAG
ncbi:cytochrome P450 [Periconia macrospinosa]|uniref:Cytochrome P450 n=1 Tax=Periconia macrospinosa TaxID=97972 RepID=A0A2V1DAL4_9PLEO|nr:cytochrome P450 [Periconia macrospinosa]